MTSIQIVAIAVRLFAVLIAVFTLRHGISGLYWLTTEHASTVDAVLIMLTVSLPLAVAVLLWAFPLTVAARITPRRDGDSAAHTWHTREVQAAALAVIGMWLVVDMLPDLANWIIFALALRGQDHSAVLLSPENLGSMASSGVQLLLGIALMMGARGMAQWLHIFRYGRPPSEDPQTQKGATGAPSDS